MVGRLERVLADRGLGHDRLDEPGAVAEDQEMDLAARTAVMQPPLDRDLLADVRADVFDIHVHDLQLAKNCSIRCRAFCARASVSLVDPCAPISKISGPS